LGETLLRESARIEFVAKQQTETGEHSVGWMNRVDGANLASS
jgi:hypothetical protein